MLLTCLKITKEFFRATHTIGTSIITGATAAIAYLVFNGFECLTSNISANVSFNAAKLNLTQILDAIFNHNGTINLPTNIKLSDGNISDCTSPIEKGVYVGVGFGAATLLSHYAHRCAKAKMKNKRNTEGYEPINSTLSV